MVKIAITGGICSGKTTICKHIEEMGHEVFYSDNDALFLAENNQELKNLIIELFGERSYIGDKYNRKYIGDIVFKNKDKLNQLNSIFKPFLDKSFQEYQKNKDTVFYESALIFEHGREKDFDYIISVYAPREVVWERLKNRNNLSSDQILNRLKNQYDPMVKNKLSDFVIDTTNSYHLSNLKTIINFITKNI